MGGRNKWMRGEIEKKESGKGTLRVETLITTSPYSDLTSLISLSLYCPSLSSLVSMVALLSPVHYSQSLLSLYPLFTFMVRLWCFSIHSSPSHSVSVVPHLSLHLQFRSLLVFYQPLTFTGSPFCFCTVPSRSYSVSAVRLVYARGGTLHLLYQ